MAENMRLVAVDVAAGTETPIGADLGGALTVATAPSGVVAATLTRPADTTAYAVGDLIANNTTAGSVTPMQLNVARVVDKPAVLRRLRLKTNNVAWKGATVRVHLFHALPVSTVGDNGVFNNAETYACNEALYVGFQDVTLSQAFSDFAKGFVTIDAITTPASGFTYIYALLEARTASTPGASQTFQLVIEALRD